MRAIHRFELPNRRHGRHALCRLPIPERSVSLPGRMNCTSSTTAGLTLRRRRRNAASAGAKSRCSTLEQYASLAWLDGNAYPADELNDAWKKLLFNEFHDLAAGSGAEQIYKDAQEDFTQIQWATNEISSKSLAVLKRQIDTRVSTGVPVVVFNPLAWQRTGLVNVDVQMPAPTDGVTVLGTDNQPMPLQVISKDAKTNTYHLLLKAENLPSMGYAVIRVVPGKRAFATDLKAHGLTIENGFLRVTVDPHTGCITSLYDKKDSFESLAAGACGDRLEAYTDIPKVWDASEHQHRLHPAPHRPGSGEECGTG